MADTKNDKNSNSPASTSAPALRFPGYTEPWCVSKLNSYLKENKERNKRSEFAKEEVLSVSGQDGIINQIKHLGRSFAGKSVADYHVVRHGNIVYTKSPLKEYPYGIVKYNRGVDGIVSTLYAVYETNNMSDGAFIEYYFASSNRINRYFKPIVRIGAKHDMKIGNEEVLQNTVCFPDITEQKKIAAFLSLLDERIATQRRLIEDLEKLKSSIVDRTFSDVDGEVVKYRDILEVSNLRNDGKSNYIILSASQEFGMIERESLDIDIKAETKSVKTYKRVLPGDYVLHLRSFQGGLAFAEVEGICSPAYTILRPNKRLEYGYLKEYFNSSKFIKSLVLVTYGIRDGRSINVEEFLDMNISIHHKDKQTEIVKSLSNLSDKLNVEASILNRYEQQRNYLLGKLFI